MKNTIRCNFLAFFLCVLLSILLHSHVEAQTASIDSLENVLRLHPEKDTARINILISLCFAYLNEINDKKKVKEKLPEIKSLSEKRGYGKGINYSRLFNASCNLGNSNSAEVIQTYLDVLKQFETAGDRKGTALSYQFLSQAYYHIGRYKESIEGDVKSIAIKSEINDQIGIANSYNGIGCCYYSMGDYQQAMENYFNALKISEEQHAKFGVSRMQLNIACVLIAQDKLDEGLNYMEKALETKTEINDLDGVALTCSNMASVLYRQKEFEKAIEYCMKAIAVSEKTQSHATACTAYINLGGIYVAMGRIDEALPWLMKAYQGATQTDNKVTLIAVTISIGNCYEQKKKYEMAISYYKKALQVAQLTRYRTGIRDAYSSLSSVYEKLGNYKEALSYNRQLSIMKDSLLNEESMKQTAELNTRYETEKKEKEILLLTKDQQLKDKTLREQRLVRIGLIVGLVLFLCLSFLLFNRYRFKQKANLILEKQKAEIHQKNVLITDSIDYAKTIQDAILPDPDKLNSFFPQHFILYKPKAIVSGDFYWLGRKNDQLICAVADCTGHGIPGAFMSLLGHNILENVVQRTDAIHSGAILSALNQEIVNRFSGGKNETVKHGMDIAIISMDEKQQVLHYAGAGNSVYIVREKKLIELKADKMSTGIVAKDGHPVVFTDTTFQLRENDMLYLFSDGFPDQKGGPAKKKFYYQAFKELLTKLSELPPEEQQQQLDMVINDWMNGSEQIDDILIMGIRIS